MRKHLSSSLLALLSAMVGNALAQQSIPVAPSSSMSVEQFEQQLSPPPRKAASRGIVVEGEQPATQEAPSVDLNITFDSGSSRITTDSRILLDTLTAAMEKPSLKNYRFIIAGHTDATGNDALNLALSRKRAHAVAQYLNQGGVTLQRLQIEGYGRTRLLDPAHPNSGINRRVQIINIGVPE